MQNLKVMAVVVTYNRKKLLLECVDSLLHQSYKLNKIIIIDNNSDDGTDKELEKNGYIKNEIIFYNKMSENLGGTGGFYEGMKLAREMNADWVWIMDDDTIPKEDSLEEFIKALDVIKDEKISFLASNAFGTKGECMSDPAIDSTLAKNNYPEWQKYLNEGIIKIKSASFVSILINVEAMKEAGLPFKDYFIWDDDYEYTLRLNKYFGPSYMVGKSMIIHKRKAGGVSLPFKDETDLNRIKLNYYRVRNRYINLREYDKKIKLFKYFLGRHRDIIVILFSKSKYKMLKIKTILKGLYAGIFKKYDYEGFKNRLNS